MSENRLRTRLSVKTNLQLFTPGFRCLLLHVQRYPLFWLKPLHHWRKLSYSQGYSPQGKELVNFALQSVNEFSYFCANSPGVRGSEGRIAVNVKTGQNEASHQLELLIE